MGPSAGLTLVELMIAAGLLTTALVLVFGSLISVSQTRRLSESRTVAAAHISSVFEELQGVDAKTLLSYSPPTFTGLGAQEQVVIRLFAEDGAVVTLPLGESAPSPELSDPCEVQVVVTWQDQERLLSQSASTMLSLGV
jgi:hypothetical protein